MRTSVVSALLVCLGITAGAELEHRYQIRDQIIDWVAPYTQEAGEWIDESVDNFSDLLEGQTSSHSAPDPDHKIWIGKVVKVVDGDTIDLLVDRAPRRIRLDQIDTPEKGQDWGRRATRALSQKIAGKQVEVEVSGTDRYSRWIGTIWMGDRNINREMVAEGHAWVYRQYLKDQSLLTDERRAREAGLGLWSMAEPIPPWEWRRR